ncbi:efflux RND transporter periplasmic adaptor subunit [Aestuariibaculum suncheonense]|nr:HlyD family efflux transporter periplasmic adaptor subunit [Aestuariibaculum suncheonense]
MPLTESVYCSVTVQPDSLYLVYSVVSGILDENFIEEGDNVSKNQQIIQIINSTPKLNAETAKFNLILAKENFSGKAAVLNGLKTQINAAHLKYENDSVNYFRQKKLWEQHIGSKSEYDTKKLNYELSYNNLITLRNNYDRTKNELEAALKQSENNYQNALIINKDFTVKSKIKGKVYALYKEPGEIVTSLEPLAAIGSATNFIIEMLVDEVDIVSLEVGQEALIYLDAYQEHVFKGHVSKIYPKKDERNQTFTLEAVFEEAPEILYPGLSGEANIIIAKKDSVLVIPKDFLTADNYVKTDDGFVPVVTGLKNMEFVQIISGITKETLIYKPE